MYETVNGIYQVFMCTGFVRAIMSLYLVTFKKLYHRTVIEVYLLTIVKGGQNIELEIRKQQIGSFSN